jgi:type II secretory pathway component GspD/PulD (secretin)
MLIFVVTVPVCSAGTARSRPKPPHPTALELLDKYTETQDSANAVVITKQVLDDIIRSRKQLDADKLKHRMTIDAVVYEKLETIVDLSQLTTEMPLSEAIEELKNSVEPPLTIFVLWRDLSENADIERTTPINMDGISAVELGTALKLLLMSVSGGFGDLDYVVDYGAITIATKELLPSKMETRVYAIFDLVDVALDPNTGKVAGYNEDDANDILGHIIDMVEPDSWWESGGEGRIAIYKGKLIVFQTREIHQKVEQFLSGLRPLPGKQGMTKPAIEIESRLLMVSEGFLEDFGLDVNSISNADGKSKPAVVESPDSSISEACRFILDDPNVSFLIRATQAHEDSKVITAPKVTVFDSEEAAVSINKQVTYISGYTEPNRTSGGPQPKRDFVDIGTWWKVTPQIMPDNKHILLDVDFEQSVLLGFQECMYKEKYPYKIPQTEVVGIKARLVVPDGRTVIIGGQKITAEEDGRRVQKELLVLIKAKKVDSESLGTYRGGYGSGYGGMGGYSGYGGGYRVSPPPQGYGGYGGNPDGGNGKSEPVYYPASSEGSIPMGGMGGGGYGGYRLRRPGETAEDNEVKRQQRD